MKKDNIELLKKKIIMGLSEKEAIQVIKEHIKLCRDKETGEEILIRAGEVLLYRDDIKNKISQLRSQNKVPQKLSKKDLEGLSKEEILQMILSSFPIEVLLKVIINNGSIMARFLDDEFIIPASKIEQYIDEYRSEELQQFDVDEFAEEIAEEEAEDEEDEEPPHGGVQMMSISDFMQNGMRRKRGTLVENLPWDRLLQSDELINRYLDSPRVPLQKKFRFGLEVFIKDNSKHKVSHEFIQLARQYATYLDKHPDVKFFMLIQHRTSKGFMDDMIDRTFVHKFKMRSMDENLKPVEKEWTMKYTIFIEDYSVIGPDKQPMHIEIEKIDNIPLRSRAVYKLHKHQHYPHQAYGIIFQRHGVQILDENNKVHVMKNILVAKGVAINDVGSKSVQKKHVDKQKH